MNTVFGTGVQFAAEDLVLNVDGTKPLTADTVAAITAVCDAAEDRADETLVVVQVHGAPAEAWSEDLTVALVSKWERALRRLERLPAPTVAVADGTCGGTALDALLATDYRIATASVRLTVPVGDGETWPGMAVYRLANQAASGSAVRRAVLFGAPIDAQAALGLHLVDEVTDDVADALARTTARTGGVRGSELAIRRQLILDAATTGFEEALGVHLAACDRTLRRAASGTAA
ncbi:enoyl-CoA-hydratase DpgB [Streptomyces sp. AVP053U2]|uniref:enoyl-CoA-hydratase DpgB n=1 Tax=Streptomyces sp. AVP053U2 TaxID=1737066 RepID=UPI00073AEDF7|nr:enoyl-CoA-hydratase DpgB [Streptomyces sp. AVP053U2]ODA70320.1 Fatty acid oxidation complex subunit alpha [Streptomyces sp. AVP053U2]